MQKILGLDIGSYSIKAVEILNTFKTYKVTRLYEIVIPEIEGLDQHLIGMTAVRQLFAENEIDADRTYTAMMGLLVSMRVLNLQNVKKRMVQQIVENELESSAPFSLEDVVIDQQVIDQKDGTTSVLAVMCRKDHVEAYLNGLKELDIEPKIIDVDYLSFLNLYPYLKFDDDDAAESMVTTPAKKGALPEALQKCRLVIDIGHLKTSMVLFNNGRLVTARTIRMGGRYFTDTLQKALGVSFNEAQRLKHAVSYVEYRPDARPAAGNEREFSVARHLGIAVTELVKELIRTLHSFKAQERLIPESIVITGGSSSIRNLPEFLQEMLEIPVGRMKFDSARLKIDEVDLVRSPTIAQALAVGLRGVPGKVQSSINLRKGELALVGSYDAVIRQVANISLLVASLLVCLMASYGLRWWLYGRQITALKDQYKKEVVQVLGTEPRNLKNMSAGTSWDIKAYASQAQKIITEEIKTRDAILQQFSTRKSAFPLRVLEEVSRSIPKDTLIDVTNFSMQGNQVVIEGETDSFTTSEKILDLLKGVPSFSTVERKSQENKPGSEGKIVKFTVSATLKEGG
ncbi:MAG: pilus assembly protein PilM [Silvanigrellales bacterium]|nr:pilus assembly protein PilM [Silvanigrellales bacterium]